MPPNYANQIHALDDDDLERLVDAWQTRKTAEYDGTERFSGARDMGRDVVGYITSQRLDGPWHNFQCKQLKTQLTKPALLRELAKIIFHSSCGHFQLPERFYFVAPRGLNRKAKELISQPSKLAAAMIDEWDESCAQYLVQNETHELTDKLRKVISAFDFTSVDAIDSRKLVADPAMKAVLVEWFGADPGPAPSGVVPESVAGEEFGYFDQLAKAYGARSGTVYASRQAALDCEKHGKQLSVQRTRFFEASYFKRYYRDNTPRGVVEAFETDVYYGVLDIHQGAHADSLAKVDAVMSQAAVIQVSGVLGPYARVPVKQGTCHHLANDGILPWTD
ncbi:MAG: hypothetical protein HEQ34_01580 [Sphingorhabdus sp.]|uniref:ABC-three component system protein n=1 Tax=Sphingorhabdus sp. TaxID=1902408 RepID=UPI0025FCA3A8|nr:ABC-three component system protein [Sphingorhabdus sp.]MCO4090630.1 hypothetical protein [Sphingorhabdus sp.]